MPYDFELSDIIPASPNEIYDAWLDALKHRDMTGAPDAAISARVGARFSIWEGYITGKNLELDPGKRIVQSWRTTEFPADHPDSRIEVTLAAVKGGTKITIRHTGVPDGQTDYEQGGWQENYFDPMKRYFGKAHEKP